MCIGENKLIKNNKKVKYLTKTIVLLALSVLIIGRVLPNERDMYIVVNDKNLEGKVETFLENLFMVENFEPNFDDLISICEVGHFFTNKDERLKYIYNRRFYTNLKRNDDKTNIKFDVELKEIYEDDKSRLKVLFNYNRSFNIMGVKDVKEESTTYEAILLREQQSFLIDKIYDVDVLKRDSLLEFCYSKESLYEKYIDKEYYKYKNLERY